MRARVTFMVDVDDTFRRALRFYYGLEGLASREEVKHWFRNAAASMNHDMLHTYRLEQMAPEDRWKEEYPTR